MSSTRDYSPISVEDRYEEHDDGPRSSVISTKFYKEAYVFRSVGSDKEEDDYPSFLLSDVTIFKANGVSLCNVLNAELEGMFTVRGKLVIDEADETIYDLKKESFNGAHIEVKSQTFSILGDPVTIWVRGSNRWFEVCASDSYVEVYRHMAHGIEIFFIVGSIYEKSYRGRYKKTAPPIEVVIFKYASVEGSGLNQGEAVQRIVSHAGFLLSQMRKDGRIRWTSTIFFKWLAGECPDIYNDIRAKNGEERVEVERVILQLPAPPEEIRNSPQLTSARSSPPDSPARPAPKPTKSRSIVNKLHSSMAESLKTETVPGAIVDLLLAALEEGTSQPKQMSFSHVAILMNYNFSISYNVELYPKKEDHQYCLAILRYYAKEVRDLLKGELKNTKLYKELYTAMHTVPQLSAKGKQWDELFAAEMKKLKLERRSSNSRRASGTDTHLTTKHHPEKSILVPLSSGRRSGKQAAIPGPAKRRASAESDENEFSGEFNSQDVLAGGRMRKRRRQSPLVETGDEYTDDNNSITDGSNLGESTTFSLVSTTIPSTTPTGPDGTWICPYHDQGCGVTFHDTESGDGKEALRDHLLGHAKTMEEHIEQEAGPHRPIDNLLDRIRELGQAARPNLGVAPIRRAMYS